MSTKARTRYVRKVADSRPSGHDGYVEDLLRIERALLDGETRGVAGTMMYLNLISRYPRETEAIARELRRGVPRPLHEERIADLQRDRLRLAEARLQSERGVAGEFGETA